MKTLRSKEKAVVAFCCVELFQEVCEKEFPRIRLSMSREGNIRPKTDNYIFKFCPFCGKLVRTTLVLTDGKARRLPQGGN